MKKAFQSILDFLLFSNVFMSLCAVAQALVTYHLIDARPNYTILALLFTATLGIYNFCILITKPKEPQQSPHLRIRWFFAHYRLMITFTLVSVLSLVPLFFMISTPARLLLIFSGIISVCYALPIFTLGDQKFGLRNIPGLKPFLITVVWTLSTVLLPILEAKELHLTTVSMQDTTLLIAKRFLFIFALTVPFDIRDFFEDNKLGVKTIPVIIGQKNAYIFCAALLTGYVIMLFLYHDNGFNADFWALTFTAALSVWLIFKSKWEKNEYYYFFYMDGVLILQFVFLALFKFI